ncbi:MAG: LptF/LptG family permease [Planctomycetes bacterium]|nr:LptF/LptG family permease [Planctomycetota bacterium]
MRTDSSILVRHVIAEITKVLVLTTAVMVIVVAFGAVIRPLAQNLLGPVGVVKYVALATVPMMQFALPFAGGLAATLVTHRMVSDNEFLAMSVSGLSYRSIFKPHLILGVALAVIMAILVNAVIPPFWVAMKSVITQDAAAVFVSTIRDGRAFDAGRMLVYADEAELLGAPDGVSDRIGMRGVVAVEFGPGGVPDTEFVAESAVVDLYRVEGRAGQSRLLMKASMREVSVVRLLDGTVAFVPEASPDAVEVQSGSERSPNMANLIDLVSMMRNPDVSGDSAQRRAEIARMVRSARALALADAQLRRGIAVPFVDDRSGRRYELRAAGIQGGQAVGAPGGAVIIEESQDGRLLRRGRGPSARLEFAPLERGDDPATAVRLTISLIEPMIEGPSSSWPETLDGVRPELTLPIAAITPDALEEEAFAASRNTALLGPIATSIGSMSGVWAELRREVVWEATAHAWMRFAQAACAPLLLLMGAVLAVLMRRSSPLLVYAIAFVPAIIDILLINSGRHFMRDGQLVSGFMLMWSGNAAVAGIVWWAWRKVAVH